MPMSDRYFELNDDIGVTVDGNPEPLVAQGLTMLVPVMAGDDVVDQAQSILIEPARSLKDDEHARIVPGTRIVHATNPQVCDVLLQTGHYHEIDPPTKTELTKLEKATVDASEEAGTHTEPGEE